MTIFRGFLIAALSILGGLALFVICQRSPKQSSAAEEYLKCLFCDDFGFTLVGEKPCSLDNSQTSYLKLLFPEDVEKATKFLKTTFSKSDRFILREINGDLWLINKQSLSKTISKYNRLRSFVIKKFKSTERFIKFLQDSDSSLFEALDYRYVLIGIAFGYGEENAEFFVRRIDLGLYLQKFPFVTQYPFEALPMVGAIRDWNLIFDRQLGKPKSPKPSPDFPSFQDEWLSMKKVDWPLYLEVEPELPYYICLPAYISRHGEESERVHARYLRARDKLAKLFCGRKFSEVIAEEARK